MDDRDKAQWKRTFTIGPILFTVIFWSCVGTYAALGDLTVDGVIIFGACSTIMFMLIALGTAWDLSNKRDERKWVKCSKCMGTGKVLAESQLMKWEQKPE